MNVLNRVDFINLITNTTNENQPALVLNGYIFSLYLIPSTVYLNTGTVLKSESSLITTQLHKV